MANISPNQVPPGVNATQGFLSKRDDDDLVPHPKCSPPELKQSNLPKRDFDGSWDTNHTLHARTMTMPNGRGKAGMDRFMKQEMKPELMERIIWPRIVRGEEEDMATAVYREFTDNKALSLGTDGLCGCTVLTVVSRNAVYMAHYFESVSFAPDREWEDHYESRGQNYFEATVVKGLRRGIRREQEPLPSEPFDNDDVKVYLLHPNRSWDPRKNDFETFYKKRWNQIKSIVVDIIPAAARANRWKDIEYQRLHRESAQLDNTARGRILFKYDPDHRYIGPDGTERTQKKAALWNEQDPNPKHDDTWDDQPVS